MPANNSLTVSIAPNPGFVVVPNGNESTLVTRLNTASRFVIKADDTQGRLLVEDPLTIKNSVNDVNPIRLTQLIDVNSAILVDGATLIYNGNTQFFETRLLTEFEDLTIDNLTVSAISANGSVGAAGQVLLSNGTTVYWGDQVELPEDIDGGFY
jgi:hypothetical protein